MAKKDRTEPAGASAAASDPPAAGLEDRAPRPDDAPVETDRPREENPAPRTPQDAFEAQFEAAAAAEETLPTSRDEPTPRSAASLLVAGLLGGVTGAVLLAAAVVWLAPLGEITDRVAAVENAVGHNASRRALETAERRIAALEARPETPRQEADRPAPPSVEVDLGPLVERIGRLDQAIGAGRERLDRVERLASERPTTIGTEAAQLSVALIVREKLRGGLTVPAELASLEALGVDGALMSRIRDFAREAPPAPARLASDFERVLPEIIRSEGAHAGIGDRLTAALSSAVKIRRIDEPVAKDAGDPPDAIRTALRNDDPVEAQRLWNALPPAAKEVSRDFGRAVAARAAAVTGADALVAALVDRVALAARNAGARR